MIAVTRCYRAIGVVLILTTPSTANDSPVVAANSVASTRALPLDEPLENDAGRLESRRPYERGKVPVVLIHGLWGSPGNWNRLIEDLEANPCFKHGVNSGPFNMQAVTRSPIRPTCCGSHFARRVGPSIPIPATQPSTEWSSWGTAWAASWRK